MSGKTGNASKILTNPSPAPAPATAKPGITVRTGIRAGRQHLFTF